MLYRYRADRDLYIEILGCSGLTGSVYPRIAFTVRIQNPFDFAMTFLYASGDLAIMTPKGPVHLGAPYFFSRSIPFQPVNLYALRDSQADLALDLDWGRLEYIEEQREGDLILAGGIRVLCACLAVNQKGQEQSIESLMWVSGQLRRGNRGEFPIYQTEWIKILEELGYGKRRLIEIVLPSVAAAAKEIVTHVEAADSLMHRGEYDSVLVSCRKALETFERTFNAGTVDLKTQLGSASKADCVDGIRKKLKEFLHMGAHPGTRITRADADFALLLTKTLFAYIGSPSPSKP